MTPVTTPTARALPGHLAAAFCFSAGPVGLVVQKLLVATFSPFVIIAVQMIIGGCVLWFVSVLVSRARIPVSAVGKGLALGVMHPGGFMILHTAASARLDAITLVLLTALFPTLTAVAARLVLKEPLKPTIVAGLMVSLTGLIILVSDRQATGESTIAGYLLAAAGMACATAGIIAGRKFNTGTVLPWYRLAPLQVTGAALTAGAGVVLLDLGVDLSAIADHRVPFAYLAVVMTAATYLAYNFALSRVPVPWLSIYIAAGPAVGTLAAVIIFDDSLTGTAVLGVAVILFGAALPHLRTLLRTARSRKAAI